MHLKFGVENTVWVCGWGIPPMTDEDMRGEGSGISKSWSGGACQPFCPFWPTVVLQCLHITAGTLHWLVSVR